VCHSCGGLDDAELTFYLFFIFFLGLVWYLQLRRKPARNIRSVATSQAPTSAGWLTPRRHSHARNAGTYARERAA
jgi:hypothetical protein